MCQIFVWTVCVSVDSFTSFYHRYKLACGCDSTAPCTQLAVHEITKENVKKDENDRSVGELR